MPEQNMLIVTSIFNRTTINKKMRLDHESLRHPETRILKSLGYKNKGVSYEHRRTWMKKRLFQLYQLFFINIFNSANDSANVVKDAIALASVIEIHSKILK